MGVNGINFLNLKKKHRISGLAFNPTSYPKLEIDLVD